VLKEGDGTVHPKRGDRVRVHYTGWLEDGTEFDSSRRRGEPSEFGIGQVIEGWNEGLALMSPGSRLKLTIPSDLAYGAKGSPPKIPADATLVFDVELIAITASAPEFVALDSEKATVTESGLKMQTLVAPTGPACAAESDVWFEYTFWDQAGTFFDSSITSGAPAVVRVDKFTIPFFKEAAMLMGEGGTYVFEVPAALGFGERATSTLPPNSVTIWRLTLKRIFQKPAFSMPAPEELTTTESGLQYQVLREGEGKSPAMHQGVICHYAGWLTDGTQFDASYDRGDPLSFRLGRVIEGWNEGLKLMKPGAMMKLVIPGNLGYGARGQGTIPPDATLVFVVELIAVN
jgi:FKBP-type peptidyl-prolyl cis-trans isomerase